MLSVSAQVQTDGCILLSVGDFVRCTPESEYYYEALMTTVFAGKPAEDAKVRALVQTLMSNADADHVTVCEQISQLIGDAWPSSATELEHALCPALSWNVNNNKGKKELKLVVKLVGFPKKVALSCLLTDTASRDENGTPHEMIRHLLCEDDRVLTESCDVDPIMEDACRRLESVDRLLGGLDSFFREHCIPKAGTDSAAPSRRTAAKTPAYAKSPVVKSPNSAKAPVVKSTVSSSYDTTTEPNSRKRGGGDTMFGRVKRAKIMTEADITADTASALVSLNRIAVCHGAIFDGASSSQDEREGRLLLEESLRIIDELSVLKQRVADNSRAVGARHDRFVNNLTTSLPVVHLSETGLTSS